MAGVAGTRGAQLMSTPIPLTPGPLVVVLKDSCPDRDEPTSKCGPAWPPSKATAVETIAASFVPMSVLLIWALILEVLVEGPGVVLAVDLTPRHSS